ncbi:MAG TPA: hypothetical protein VNX21_08150 [Candidatus Thermoplasmatota archaeon]|nr:hypothetical protein [Candidatus Thermoplasmatota archaeon]
MPGGKSDMPLVWRLRHQLGAVAFYAAIAITALGAWTVLRGTLEGDLPSAAVGLTLIVGGMLVMVGRRNRRKRS